MKNMISKILYRIGKPSFELGEVEESKIIEKIAKLKIRVQVLNARLKGVDDALTKH